MPITWKNVTGFNTASQAAVGAELFKQSREALSDGIGGIQNILKQHQDQTQDAWKQGKENNTNAYLDRLAQAKTPEELAALQASGELQAMKQQWGAQFDSAGVRDYEAGLQQKLIERITAQNQYADSTRDRNEFAAIDEIKGLIANKDYAGATQRLDANQYRQEAPLYDLIRTGQRGDTEFQWKGEDHRSQLANRNLDNQVKNLQIQKAQTEAYDAKALREGMGVINQYMQQPGATEDGLQGVMVRYAMGANLPQGAADQLLKAGKSRFEEVKGLTPDQQAAYDAEITPFKNAHASRVAGIKSTLDEVIALNPTNTYVEYTDTKNLMNPTDVYADMRKEVSNHQFWDNNSDDVIKDTLVADKVMPAVDAFFETQKDVPGIDKVKGLILKRAWDATTRTEDVIGEDKSFDLAELQKNLLAEANRYAQSHKSFETVRTAQQKALEEQNELDAALAKETAAAKSRYTTQNLKRALPR